MPSGIPARSILRFLDYLEDRAIPMHSFLMIRGGKTVAEGYWKPFTAEIPHRMFSVSKSVTSLLIGILAAEGKLSLDDPIAQYFPDKLPEAVSDRILRMTIRDMLRMATAHKFTTYKLIDDDDWTRTFFTVPPTNDPGAVFAYDTSSSHTLAALVQRLTGKSARDFAVERLFQPLGCTGEVRWLADPTGVCQGGTGLITTTENIARLALCCMRGGEDVIPADYLREATAAQIATPMQPACEERFGYGYQFWRMRHNGFAMYGMGGQLAICLPDYDFILCTTADTQLEPGGMQIIWDALWEIILPALKDSEAADTAEELAALDARIASLAMKPVANDPALEAWPTGRYRFDENPLGLRWLEVERGILRYENNSGECTLGFGMGELQAGTFPGNGEPCLVSGGFIAPETLHVYAHLIGDTPCGMAMLIAFDGARVTVKARAVNTPLLTGYEGVASGVLV